MSKYVDIEKILNDKGYATRFPNTSDLYYHESILQYAPAEDVAPVVHAHWNKTCVPDVFQCSYCKKPVKMDELCDSEVLREYCPKCGAKMDEETCER